MMEKPVKNPLVYVVSGGKGVAGHSMLQSLLVQYPENNIQVVIVPDVRSTEKADEAIVKIMRTGGFVVHTLVTRDLRNYFIQLCDINGIHHADMMGKMADFIEQDLGLKSINEPGLFHRINAPYFQRVEAIEYTMEHDDGVNPERLFDADVILTGVSRAGKTPLSIYMAMFGWKVANVPLVEGIQPPEELFKVDPRRVFGLLISAEHLIAHRHKRLAMMGQFPTDSYTDQHTVRKELMYANLIFERGGFTKINVTNKPIESTANEILHQISDRFGHSEQKLSL